MSKITIETTITPRYLRNRTKDQLIDLVLSRTDQNDPLIDVLEFWLSDGTPEHIQAAIDKACAAVARARGEA